MSEFRLRALLEERDFTSTLQQQNITDSGKLYDGGDKRSKLEHFPATPLNSALLNQNIWADSARDDDFNLEYMDLDEFLSETGLVDTNFSNLLCAPADDAAAHESLPNGKPRAPAGTLEDLLTQAPDIPVQSAGLSPSSTCSSTRDCVITTEEALSQYTPSKDSRPSHIPKEKISKPTGTTAAVKEDVGLVKKRKYKEDGEGLTDTSVVVVPGKDGFNPAQAKFNPEELQPQPIIKKSKKQFVSDENKDDKYWRRRNKNNVAAKRSREARRAKENQIIMRAGFLESENARLTDDNEKLLLENQQLKSLVEKLRSQSE